MLKSKDLIISVSTHSRLKAAGFEEIFNDVYIKSFNTQPPKGGWNANHKFVTIYHLFQHTAA